MDVKCQVELSTDTLVMAHHNAGCLAGSVVSFVDLIGGNWAGRRNNFDLQIHTADVWNSTTLIVTGTLT